MLRNYRVVNFLKSPLNYVGGKHKIIGHLKPLFPQEIGTFVDLFCGGLTVTMNAGAKRHVANDFQPQVIDFYKWCKATPVEGVVGAIDALYVHYSLSKTNQEGYLALRTAYNAAPSADKLFALVTNSFNHQLRWNSKGQFNMPFGRNRHEFNERIRKNLVGLVEFLHSVEIEFTCQDFRDYGEKLKPDMFIYCDPPYRLSTAVYNTGWTEKDDADLLALLDKANEAGCGFALSCVLVHNGVENEIISPWSEKYTVHDIDWKYGNSSYHKKDRSKGREVCITNLKV